MECIIDFEAAEKYCAQVQTFAVKYRMYIVLGCAVRRGGRIFNSVRGIFPGEEENFRLMIKGHSGDGTGRIFMKAAAMESMISMA